MVFGPVSSEKEYALTSASMDKSAILHTTPPIILPHPTYVKSILSLDYTLTGSDDEDIRVWDGAKCISTVPGHCDEVTALRSWGAKVVSASLDGTLRRWEMRELLNPSPLQYDKVSASELTEEELRELDELMDE
jgi:WD40 repeat protein